MWIWCLLKANFDDAWIPIETGRGTTEVMVRRGQFVFGRKSAAKSLNMNENTIYKRMLKLKTLENLNIESNNHYSIVTILNYELYQILPPDTVEHESNTQVTTKEHPSNTDKNDKKNKEEEDIIVTNNHSNNNVFSNKTVFCASGDALDPVLTPETPSKKKSKKAPLPQRLLVSFERFWSAWPKRRARADAEKAWAKIDPDDALIEIILAAVEKQKRSVDWTKQDRQFIPMPASWLNGRRWEDEVEEPYNPYEKLT